MSFYLKTILDGSWFFFKIRCSSFKATTHLVFSLSVSANIKHWWRTPGGSIRLVVTRKIHGTSFLLAWMTSLSRTVLTSNSGSRMSNTWLTATPKKRYRQVRNWFCFAHACQYFTFMFKNWYLAFQNCVIRCIAYLLQDLCILKTKIFRLSHKVETFLSFNKITSCANPPIVCTNNVTILTKWNTFYILSSINLRHMITSTLHSKMYVI